MRIPIVFLSGFFLGTLLTLFIILSSYELSPAKDKSFWSLLSFKKTESMEEGKGQGKGQGKGKKVKSVELSLANSQEKFADKDLERAKTSFQSEASKEKPDDQKISLKLRGDQDEGVKYPAVAKVISKSELSHKKDLFFCSEPNRFSLCKLGTGTGPTLMVVGGIQGDEPGGFSAASLLSTHYLIKKGSVWVVPDLNFSAILQRSRGLSGDLNRKFAQLDKKDPEYDLVRGIQEILLHDKVDLILNLHDGSGFYRPDFESSLRNPSRWGQSLIIDQTKMKAPRFSQLHDLADEAQSHANNYLLDPLHKYHIRNTNTVMGDKEMEKSLSYFAVINGKPAFGIEASKEFTTEFRTYYHILLVEAFMKQMGIDFDRNFSMNPDGILVALNSDLNLSLYNNRVILPLDNIRPNINFLPFKKGENPNSLASRPLLSLVDEKNKWRVAYGNKTLCRIEPEYMDFDDSLETLIVNVDGQKRHIRIGELLSVSEFFIVDDMAGYRVNAIGAVKEINGTEAGVKLAYEDFMPRFSVDKAANIFRVEIYKGDAFSGMFLVNFGESLPEAFTYPLTSVREEESELGY